MVTIVSTSPIVQVLPLCCAIPLRGLRPFAAKGFGGIEAPQGAIDVESKGPPAPPQGGTERVLTLQPFARRHHLPDAILDSPTLQHALASGTVRVIKETLFIRPTTTLPRQNPLSPRKEGLPSKQKSSRGNDKKGDQKDTGHRATTPPSSQNALVSKGGAAP